MLPTGSGVARTEIVLPRLIAEGSVQPLWTLWVLKLLFRPEAAIYGHGRETGFDNLDTLAKVCLGCIGSGTLFSHRNLLAMCC